MLSDVVIMFDCVVCYVCVAGLMFSSAANVDTMTEMVGAVDQVWLGFFKYVLYLDFI